MPVLDDPRRERFAQLLAKGVVGRDAYTMAGFRPNSGNYVRMKRMPEVEARVAEITGLAAESVGITIADVFAELGKIAFSDMRDMFTSTGQVKRIEDLDDDTASALSSIEVVTKRVAGGGPDEVEHVAKFKMHDKLGALEKIGKHLGMFVDKVALTDSAGKDIEMSDIELARILAFQLTKASKQAE